MPLMLRDYQIKDVAHFITNPRTMALGDPGTGKTPPACVYTYWMWKERQKRSIWVQPKSLMDKNRDELLGWSHFKEDEVVLVDGAPKKRRDIYAGDAKTFLMGPDMFAKEWELLLEHHPDVDLLVGDEWHMMFSTHSSKRTQSMYRFARRVERILPMTGTLINGRYDSAYPALHIIEPRYYGNHESFLAQHAEYDYWGSIVGWRNPERLREIIARHSVRHTFEEAYGKEAKIIFVEEVDMKPKMKAMYDRLEEQALIEMEDEYVDASLPGVHALRCRQVMQCPEIFQLTDETTAKDERLEVHFNDSGAMVVFAVFVPEQERLLALAQKCGRRAQIMNGSTPAAERGRIDKAFQAGELDCLIVAPKVAQVGFNWGHLDHIVFSSMDYQDGDFIQAYRRGIRGRREKPLRITVQRYKCRVDRRVSEIVERKSKEANAVDPNREVFSL